MIVGVAIRNENVIIQLPKPSRHHDCFRYCRDVLGIRAVKDKIGFGDGRQGFITSGGLYLTREEARVYVEEVSQELRVQPNGTINESRELFSEDLW